nr:hypothetical protein [Natrinema soli]
MLIVVVTRLLGCALSNCSYTTLSEIDQRLTTIDIFSVLIAVDVTFHVLRKIGVSRFPTGTCDVFAFKNAKTIVLPAVGAFDMFRLYLGNFKRSKPNVVTQLDGVND